MGMFKITKNINKVLNRFNYYLLNINHIGTYNPDKVLLNIGSGDWSCKGWTNLDYPTKNYKKVQKGHKFIPYNIREDKIPFGNSSVDAIYCSHVIEHVESEHAVNMFKDCYRVLKSGGILRIACPDAEFLYQMAAIETDYWQWKNDSFFSSKLYNTKNKPRTIDYLVREIASPKLLGYIHSLNKTDYIDAYRSMDMYGFLNYLTNDLVYREEFTYDHISYWTYYKLKGVMSTIGFDFVIRSKWSASCCKQMKSIAKFDTTYPVMSLYVEVVKKPALPEP
ncbi:MAG: methyltransferase domain-containing protein [Prevotellaceae bacterium]|jgi:SAM-dependent methyltransferase|nr:methyltransferase domain-containing protein [Prevotellaceae bacterium]